MSKPKKKFSGASLRHAFQEIIWPRKNLVALGLGALATGVYGEPTRKLLRSFVLPKPGEGPDEKAREAGFFNLVQVGKLADGTVMRTRITGDRDPGYGSTSKMLAEAAVCLARDDLDSPGGVLTPATARGTPLLARLREHAGMTFDVVD